ncbi:MAG: hypothetical protein A2X08_01385 [Bacteroidetes bacterium GWA2_32_17]|nr:MAG: hypothetical protein A2X08_01385 [Bacteroidetes bacterium GWA2_32_17]
MSFLTLAQNKTEIECKIWNPNSFCVIPDSIYLADRVFAIHSEWKEDKCEHIDSLKNLTGVWLTFNIKKGCSLSFKTNFDNIKLIKKGSGQKVGLFAIYTSRKYFMTSIKAKKFTYHLKTGRKIDIIMLFPQAEKGDKIIIDDFIETEIRE